MLRNHVIRYKSTLGEVIGSTLNLTQTNLRVLRLPLTIEVPIFSFEAVRSGLAVGTSVCPTGLVRIGDAF
ncbi:unnamed protein product [Rhodiola kirilowii]